MTSFTLDTEPGKLETYLQQKAWLRPGERLLRISKPGEGNMNVVLRLHTDSRSLILKQSRPYVQKYPQIPAPLDRIGVEYQFYKAVFGSGVSKHMPEILGYAAEDHLMLLEDLGESEDLTTLYTRRTVSEDTLTTLVSVMESIHSTGAVKGFPENLQLRQLNHQHIFVLPYAEDNGFPLDQIQPGLEALAKPIKTDRILKGRITALGEKYLSRGATLLHGDYYPGSWLESEGKVYVIDPEFSFLGFPEFDLGVMAAHMYMATSRAEMLPALWDRYSLPLDRGLVQQVAGTEILRRLIGLAQLPLERSLDEKSALLEQACNWISNEN
ncbi:phosphotransferase [Robiginitalea sediminis]|uniref:phosphotransferase n=1 Tax=Robiginitalea sediminis TaxID=1982593 RepID=UPI000B4A56D1|nr:phosphotransferase [Robiginitalea sediminis]